jgi:coenzyme F420-reducing hydrogenase alpha subunit
MNVHPGNTANVGYGTNI